MYNLILIILLSSSQPVIIEKVAVLPKQFEMPKFQRRQPSKKDVWYAKYF